MTAGTASPGGTTPLPPAVSRPSSRFSPLYWVTRNNPTNHDMLVFRTLNRDLGEPGHNGDHLAVRLRDELMPFR